MPGKFPGIGEIKYADEQYPNNSRMIPRPYDQNAVIIEGPGYRVIENGYYMSEGKKVKGSKMRGGFLHGTKVNESYRPVHR